MEDLKIVLIFHISWPRLNDLHCTWPHKLKINNVVIYHIRMFYAVKILTFGNVFKIFDLRSTDLQHTWPSEVNIKKIEVYTLCLSIQGFWESNPIWNFPKFRMLFAVKILNLGYCSKICDHTNMKHLILISGGHIYWKSVDIRSRMLKFLTNIEFSLHDTF